MDFLFFLFMLFLFMALINGSSNKPRLRGPKTCPPHQWEWYEVKDQQGNVAYTQMRCKLCGPLSNRNDG